MTSQTFSLNPDVDHCCSTGLLSSTSCSEFVEVLIKKEGGEGIFLAKYVWDSQISQPI